jgi:hypothetical protein
MRVARTLRQALARSKAGSAGSSSAATLSFCLACSVNPAPLAALSETSKLAMPRATATLPSSLLPEAALTLITGTAAITLAVYTSGPSSPPDSQSATMQDSSADCVSVPVSPYF